MHNVKINFDDNFILKKNNHHGRIQKQEISTKEIKQNTNITNNTLDVANTIINKEPHNFSNNTNTDILSFPIQHNQLTPLVNTQTDNYFNNTPVMGINSPRINNSPRIYVQKLNYDGLEKLSVILLDQTQANIINNAVEEHLEDYRKTIVANSDIN
jgi:hypothetical protein